MTHIVENPIKALPHSLVGMLAREFGFASGTIGRSSKGSERVIDSDPRWDRQRLASVDEEIEDTWWSGISIFKNARSGGLVTTASSDFARQLIDAT